MMYSLSSNCQNSGNVGIGTKTPAASAILDLQSTNKGLLLPRMTQSQRDSIKNPVEGLIIYQTDNNSGTYLFNGNTWILSSNTSAKTLGSETSLGLLNYFTIADIRAFLSSDVSTYPNVFITDIGKEGYWYYDALDASSGDNTGTILVTSSGARYKRALTGPYRPQWFGAVADDNVNDDSAIQTCLNLGTTYLTKGTYLISNNLLVPSNRKIFGDGTSSILKVNADNIKVFNLYSNSSSLENISIMDLQIDGGGQTSSLSSGKKFAYGVYISKATNIIIERILVNKCGVINNSSVKDDNGYGGYGIVVESRNGPVSNISINQCKVTNIAGGGNVVGDGIYIAGYSSDSLNVPRNIYVTNCSVENVGRHCFTVAGERGLVKESFGENVHFSNCNCRNASLSGIDLEEGSYVKVRNMTIENAGNYTNYFNPVVAYEANYRLCTGIAYGHLSNYNTFSNIKIKKSYFGITLAGGSHNTFDNIQIDSSTVNDITLLLANIGKYLTISNSQFLTASSSGLTLYLGSTNSHLNIENCTFSSPVKLNGIKFANFQNCTFGDSLSFGSNENGRLVFEKCTFLSKVIFKYNDEGYHLFSKCLFKDSRFGILFNTFNSYCNNITVHDSEFNNNNYGIYAVWRSVKNMNIENCRFIDIDTAGIFHANSDNETPFRRIINNHFDGMTDGISINQAIKHTQIIGNSFENISSWCIQNTSIISGTSTTDIQISNNRVFSNCTNGIKIEVTTGSHDYNIISRNNMRMCSSTKASISSGNTNGYQTENFF